MNNRKVLKQEIERLEDMIRMFTTSGRSDAPIVERWEENRKELQKQLDALDEAVAVANAIKKVI